LLGLLAAHVAGLDGAVEREIVAVSVEAALVRLLVVGGSAKARSLEREQPEQHWRPAVVVPLSDLAVVAQHVKED
jgi:hypothetical protein